MQLPVTLIMEAVCHHMRIHPEEIRGRSQTDRIVKARRIIAQRMRKQDYSLERIARALNRERSTVYNYLNPETRKAKHRRYMERKNRARSETGTLQDQQSAPHP